MRRDVFEIAFSKVTLQIVIFYCLCPEKGNFAFSAIWYQKSCLHSGSQGKRQAFFSEKSGNVQFVTRKALKLRLGRVSLQLAKSFQQMVVKSLHFRHLVEDSPILTPLWWLLVPYMSQLQHFYARYQGLRAGELQTGLMPGQYIPPHVTSHLGVPVSGFPVTMDRDYDGNEMFTKYFSYTQGVKKDGYRLKTVVAEQEAPGELRNERG